MAQTADSYIWSLPNYAGQLFTADVVNTPLLTMMGGLNGGKQATNFEFPVTSEYDFPAVAQPDIGEDDSLTAPAVTQAVRAQTKNVCQIFQQSVKVSYEKMANRGRLLGINTVGSENNVADELAWQIDYNLKIIARNIEQTILNGAYQIATGETVSNRSRGLVATCSLSGGTRVNASAAALTKAMMQELFLDMFTAGAMLLNPVIFVNGYQKQALSDIYGYAPEDRNVGGVNIKVIETDFGNIGVAPAHRFMTASVLLVVDMAVVSPVFQPVPGKGNFFYEELAKTGAAEAGQIFGKFGLDHGPAFAHGELYGLATS